MKKLFVLALTGLLLTSPLSVRAEGEDDPLWNRPSFERKVYRVGQRLLQANDIEKKIAFRVLGKKDVNAYAHEDIGSVVWVDRGLLNMIESDDELAAVLGHEIAHITENHFAGARMKQVGGGILGGVIGALAIPTYGLSLLALPVVAGAASANSRGRETEADQRGIDYLVGAGYDPYAMESVLRKISSDGKSSLQIWASHPGGTKRLKRVRAYISEAYPKLAKAPTEQPDGPEAEVLAVAIEDADLTLSDNASQVPEGKAQTELYRKLALLAEHGDIPEEEVSEKPQTREASEVGYSLISLATGLDDPAALSVLPDQSANNEKRVASSVGATTESQAVSAESEKSSEKSQGQQPVSVAEALLSLKPDELHFIRLLKERQFMDAEQFRDYFGEMNPETAEAMLWGLQQKQLIRILGSLDEGVYVLTDRTAQALGQN